MPRQRTALNFDDYKVATNPARTNALLELISDQLMLAAVNADYGRQFQETHNTDALVQHILEARKMLGLTASPLDRK